MESLFKFFLDISVVKEAARLLAEIGIGMELPFV